MSLEIESKKTFQKVSSEYEKDRWKKDPIRKAAYEMTKSAIQKRLLKKRSNAQTYFELGPGPGTWTKIIYEHFKKDAPRCTLVDISGAMLRQAEEALRDVPGIEFFESSFLDFETEKQYDVFFSSRVIEYIEDKDAMAKKIVALLTQNGTGFIITKTPHYFREKLLGREIGDIHRGQIKPQNLKKLLKKYGAKNIEVYPVVINIPLLELPTLNRILGKFLTTMKLNPLNAILSESYCIYFEK